MYIAILDLAIAILLYQPLLTLNYDHILGSDITANLLLF